MKFYISTFYNLRFFDDTYIPISTCHFDPDYFHSESKKHCHNKGYFINKNNVLNGIREDILSPELEDIGVTECCQKDCPYTKNLPNCQFLKNYETYLFSLDFKYLLFEFNRIAEDTRKITKFKGEPNIVLLVYESPSNPCSERWPLKRLFKANNIDLVEFIKNNI